LLLARPGNYREEAEACFRQALDTTRQQKAKALELRAATNLARLWHEQGKVTEARDVLASIHGWFTEGFDTPDTPPLTSGLPTR